MEAARTANERTPLLGSGAASNEHGQLFRIFTSNKQMPLDENDTAFNEQMSLDGNDTAFNEQMSLDGNGTTDEQTMHFGQETPSNSDRRPKIISSTPRTFVQETNEVSLEEVVQALCSAWKRHRRPNRQVTLGFFTSKDFYVMHLAWETVTRGRHCLFPRHIIVEAVAEAIAKELLAVPQNYENDIGINFHIRFTIEKNLLVAGLIFDWLLITEELEFPVRYTETIFVDSDERPAAASEYRHRKVELYDKVCEYFRRPILRVLPNFLFFWPLSILFIGSKYMDCPMGHHLSLILMFLGCVGCLAIVVRMVLMYLKSQSSYTVFWLWSGIYSKLVEFAFLITFVVQALHFFNIDPTAEPDPKQCVKNFYNAALVTNYMSIPFVSAYIIVYFIIICQDQFNFWHWIF